MSIAKQLEEIEQLVGNFAAYLTTAGPGQDIPFPLKPAQQLIHGLGVSNEEDRVSALSQLSSGYLNASGNKDAIVTSFDSGMDAHLTIKGARLDRLLKSSKVYVNSDVFPEGLYQQVIHNGTMKPQDCRVSEVAQVHWQNLAVAVCHVQEIDLLVEQSIQNGTAVYKPKTGEINAHTPAVLLLSSPALNFSYGVAHELHAAQRSFYIESMFRNLFSATLSEGRQYIALPAAGLGAFGGDPKQYFSILMNTAKEFPNLNIIYHPAQFGKQFDNALQKANPSNVVKAHKDVLFIADALTKNGNPCAFHNPSDSDVVYGVYDVGEYWKNGKGLGYVGEEHIGAMTTAVLNSKGLNPSAYQNVVEHRFIKNDLPSTDHLQSNCLNYRFLLDVGAYLSLALSMVAFTVAALAITAVITVPTFGLGLAIGAGATAAAGSFAFFKSKHDVIKEPESSGCSATPSG